MSSFKITPDSGQAVFKADTDPSFTGLTSELFTVPLTGGAAARLNGPLPPDGDVGDFEITGDGRRVAFTAPVGDPDQKELFTARSCITPSTTRWRRWRRGTARAPPRA